MKLHNKMEDKMAGELDPIQRATITIHIGQLEQKRQKFIQMDTEIADLIEKPEDLEDEILESEELQCTIAEQICQAKTFPETSQTQQFVEATEQNIQPPSEIITTQSSQCAMEQTAQSSSAIITSQPPQSAELGDNCPSQGAALGTNVVSTSSKFSSKC